MTTFVSFFAFLFHQKLIVTFKPHWIILTKVFKDCYNWVLIGLGSNRNAEELADVLKASIYETSDEFVRIDQTASRFSATVHTSYNDHTLDDSISCKRYTQHSAKVSQIVLR